LHSKAMQGAVQARYKYRALHGLASPLYGFDMKAIRFGRTGAEVSRIGFGTWPHSGPMYDGKLPVGWAGHDEGLAAEALVRAHQLGMRHWDTADVYGGSEELIGSLWSQVKREETFLATKTGWDAGSFDHYYHPAQIRRQLERSLKSLGTSWIDLYYLHHCDFGSNDEYLSGAMECLDCFKQEGKIRFIGLSDWSCSRIAHYAPRVNPDVVQPYRNIVDDDYEASGLKQWVETNDAGVAFFAPLKHGLLLGKYEAPTQFEEGDQRARVPGFKDRALLEHLRACRREVEKRFAGHPQPILRALLGALLVDAPTGCVLVGLRNPEQVEAVAAAGEPLEPADAAWVRHLYRNGQVR
jgi:aryl-alcohol dehydrogenase-like predicted oxidoreductase